MRIIKPYYEILTPAELTHENVEAIYRRIEAAGRTCYKSEDRIKEGSAGKFVRAMVKNGHEAMLEHASMSVRFFIDRGISHEAVRHRIASYAQESSRFCNYSHDKFGNEISVIEPIFFKGQDKLDLMKEWLCSMEDSERHYFNLLQLGATPEEARTVLPTSLKTELVVTADMREWRNIFKLRAAGERGTPHPQMLEVMVPLLNELRAAMPELFGDIEPMEI